MDFEQPTQRPLAPTEEKGEDTAESLEDLNTRLASAESGMPITVIGYRSSTDSSKVGFYSPIRKLAAAYDQTGHGPQEVGLTFQNPLITDDWQLAKDALGLPPSTRMPELQRVAVERGYDGIIFRDGGKNFGPEFVALVEPEEKLVEEN